MLNKVTLIGNIGKEPETIQFESGQMTKVSLATTERWKDKQTNETKEATEWHNIIFNGKLSEIAQKYLNKGDKVYIEGKIKTRKWEKEGTTHYTTEIIANELKMLGTKPNQGEGKTNPSETPDDLPF